MRRRTFIAMAGAATLAGCMGSMTDDEPGFPAYDRPSYGEWVPDESRDAESGVLFTHVDFDAVAELDGEPEDDEDEVDVGEELPIVGLPIYALGITPLLTFGIARYPFSGVILPDEGEGSAEGVRTEALTWAGDVLVFEGEYDPTVFAEQYAEEFEEAEQRDGFAVHEGTGNADGLAFAVSDHTVVTALEETDGEYVPREALYDALERNLDDTGQLVDDEDGDWLFETTGTAPLAFGAWKTPGLMDRLDADEDDDAEDVEPVEENPVFDELESVVNTLDFPTDEAGEIDGMEARFSALFPDDAVPSEDEVQDHVVGDEDVPHEIVVEDRRVHVSVSGSGDDATE